MTYDPATGGNASGIRVFRYETAGRTEIMGQGPGWGDVMLGPGQRMMTLEEVVPRWARSEIERAAGSFPSSDEMSRVVIAVGWPMRAMWCPYRVEPNPTGYWMLRAERAIVLRRATAATPLGRFGPRDDVLPFLPLWTGFAVDTAVFAGMWGVVLFVPGIVRGAVRRRRGLCPACAYDRQGLAPDAPCPECGGA